MLRKKEDSASKPFFNEKERQILSEAIQQAELKTSGEIKVHIQTKPGKDPYKDAVEFFNRLGMAKTQLRNGILIYINSHDRKFAILGDAGINDKVPENYWQEQKDKMSSSFKEGLFLKGVEDCIADIGDKLETYFPRQEDDKDELSNTISQS